MAVYKSKIPTKDGRQWFFKVYKKDFNGNNKAHKSKKYFTKKEALEEEALFIMKRDNPLKKKFVLVADYYFKELNKIRKGSTVYSYENAYNKNIKKYFEKYYIDEINVALINNWKEDLENKKLKTSYLNKLHNILKNIFDFAIRNFGLIINPATLSGRFKNKNDKIINDNEKLKYITYDDFNIFISSINDITWKTFFMFLYYTGMRKVEVQALNWNDIDLKNKEIIVNKTLNAKTKEKYIITNTKNNLNRKIKISQILLEQLILYKKEMIKYNDFKSNWFVFGGPRFLASTTIDNNKHKYFLLSGIKEITIHEFRHSHVSLLINEYIKKSNEKNMKIDTSKFFLMMSNRMGHSLDVMQKTYMHLFPTIQDEIIDLLDNL